VVNVRVVTPGYFSALGTPILAGRAFTAADEAATLPVVIVDSGLARRYWPSESPIGKRLRIQRGPGATWLTVVGVAATIKHAALDERADLQLYLPFAQTGAWNTYLTVRSETDPVALAASLRRAVAELDSRLPVFEVGTMDELLDRSLGTRRLTDVLLAGFALTALLLAAIGIYGVMSLNVTARLREFGIRLALGAEPRAVRNLVIRRGLRLVVIGLGAGLAAAFGLTRLLEQLLYGVEPLDPLTFGVVSLVLAGVALAACGVPAIRATRADPMTALRQE
jgi:putative ABC transport system permease protein